MTMRAKRVVLIVDDDEGILNLAREALREHTLLTAASLEGAINIIDRRTDQMWAIVDLNLGGRATGLEFLRHLKKVAPRRVLPIVWTGDDSMREEEEAIEAGAFFVFRKLTHDIFKIRSYIEKSRLNEVLGDANTDIKTGLKIFSFFKEQLISQLKSARSRQDPDCISMVIFDIDGFGEFNKKHGTLVGDAALRAMGKMVLEHTRPLDLSCRNSEASDEIFIAIPHLDEDFAHSLGERIQMAIVEERILGKKNEPLTISVSFGVSQIKWNEVLPDEQIERSFEELVLRANEGPRGLMKSPKYLDLHRNDSGE